MMPPLFAQLDEDFGNRLNAGHPSEDFATYGAHIIKSIGAVVAAYGTAEDPHADAEKIAHRLLPNMLPYTVGTQASLGFVEWNGRSLTNNAPNVMFSTAANTPIQLGIGNTGIIRAIQLSEGPPHISPRTRAVDRAPDIYRCEKH